MNWKFGNGIASSDKFSYHSKKIQTRCTPQTIVFDHRNVLIMQIHITIFLNNNISTSDQSNWFIVCALLKYNEGLTTWREVENQESEITSSPRWTTSYDWMGHKSIWPLTSHRWWWKSGINLKFILEFCILFFSDDVNLSVSPDTRRAIDFIRIFLTTRSTGTMQTGTFLRRQTFLCCFSLITDHATVRLVHQQKTQARISRVGLGVAFETS